MSAHRLSADLRRERTLARASACFARRGFKGTTSRSLARATGVSEAMVWKLFGDKRGLYQAIVRRKIAASGDTIFPEEAARRSDDEAVFTTVGNALVSGMERDPEFLRLLLFSALEGEALSGMFFDARVARVIAFLSGYVRRRVRAGAFVRVEPDAAALLFLGSLAQFVQSRQVFRMPASRTLDAAEVVASAVRIFLGGIRRRPSPRGDRS